MLDKDRWTRNIGGNSIPETATYKGQVYPVTEMNYVLWGMINRLAYDEDIEPLNTGWPNGKVVLYRAVFGHGWMWSEWLHGQTYSDTETATGKVGWSAYGWDWAVNPNEPVPDWLSLPNATPNNTPFPNGLTYHLGSVVETAER